MEYMQQYESPLGGMIMTADGEGLTGLWFRERHRFAPSLQDAYRIQSCPVFEEAGRWLDIYFSGEEPDFMPPLHLIGSDFQKCVWEILCDIPYGQTTTYGAIAGKIAARRGSARMAAQAVGGAVGRNPVSIIVPCHRVVGTNGSLTGYAGGIQKKAALLKLEHADMEHLFIPKKGTAL